VSGPLPTWTAPISIPLSWIYSAVTGRRNRRYDRRAGIHTVDRPVVSVGNITAGGTGKTPIVAWLVQQLGNRGITAAIAMRGYGATKSRPSDESLEYASVVPQAPIVADPRRFEALQRFLPTRPDVDCIILDDGFQHRSLHRDLDLVLIDSTRPGLDSRLLPTGWLRERADGLRRAGAVIVTRANTVDPGLSHRIESLHGRAPIAWSRHAWRELHLLGRTELPVPVEWLQGRRLAVMLGVGNAPAVRAQIEAGGASIVADFNARDHQPYSRHAVERFLASCPSADAIFVTPKDWVKLQGLLHWSESPRPVVIPKVGIEFINGGDALMDLVMTVVRRRVEAAGSVVGEPRSHAHPA
jgi:tetraacyldisaccharide 4'-kinase